MFKFVKLRKVQLTKQSDGRKLLLQIGHSLLALASSLIVSGVYQTSAFVRIADNQLIAAALKGYMAILKRIAHEQDRMIFFAIGYSELVHDAAVDTNEFVLCFLSEQRDFHGIDLDISQVLIS